MSRQPAHQYLEHLQSLVARLGRQPLAEVGTLLADCIQAGGTVCLFGSGHSQLVALEACTRAGGLAAMRPLIDLALSAIVPDRAGLTERLTGYAAVSAALWDVRPPDVVVIVSNSGINPAPVELAQLMKERGVPVIAITSTAHSSRATPRTLDGKRLMDVADYVLDTGAPYGDATLTLEGRATGAVSGILSSALTHAMVCETVARLLERGVEPPLIVSGNTEGADDPNLDVMKPYRGRHALV